MTLIVQNSRTLLKRSQISGATPTVKTGSTQHTDGTWVDTDIYPGEIYWNMEDRIMYIGWEDISGNTGTDVLVTGAGTGSCVSDFYTENVFPCNNLLNLDVSPIGGTSLKVVLDGSGESIGMSALANSGEIAEIATSYDSFNNLSKILLRTEDNAVTELSTIGMSKDGISLFSTKDFSLISSGCSISVGSTLIELQLGSRMNVKFSPAKIEHSINSAGVGAINYHIENTSTTNNTPTTLYSIPFTTSNSVITVKAIINGNEDGGGDAYGAELFAVFKNVAGTVTQLSTTDKVEKTDFATATSDIIVSGTNIIIQVTGETATDINWVSRFNYQISA
jgi:hypothetical protein